MWLTWNDLFYKVQNLVKANNYWQIVESFSKELQAVLDDITCNEWDWLIDCYYFNPFNWQLSMVLNINWETQNVLLQIQDDEYFKWKQWY